MVPAPFRALCLLVALLVLSSCGYRLIAPGETDHGVRVRLGALRDLSPGARLSDALRRSLHAALGASLTDSTADEPETPELRGEIRRMDAQPLAFANGVRQVDEVVVQATLELWDPAGRLLWLSGTVERRAVRDLSGSALSAMVEDQRATAAAVEAVARALAERLRERA